MTESVPTKIQILKPKLHATLNSCSPVLSYDCRTYRIKRVSTLEGRFYRAVILEGMIKDVTIVIYSELNSSVTNLAGWIYFPTDFSQNLKESTADEARKYTPVLKDLMSNITVKDLIDEIRSHNFVTNPRYEFNNKKDFHYLVDVLNRKEPAFEFCKPERYIQDSTDS